MPSCSLFLPSLLLAVSLTLGDTRLLAAPSAKVIELRATYFAAAYELDGVDHRRVEREHTLHAFTVGNLPDGKVCVDAGASAPDADAFVGLNAGAFAFDDLDVHDHRVARLEVRNVLASGKLGDLFF